MTKSFNEKLTASIVKNNSLLGIGLDPNPTKYPAHFAHVETDAYQALLSWGQNLIELTQDLVCCYKPNFAFYEQYGPSGLEALRDTISAVPDEIPVLLDAKRGDIGNTAAAYAEAAFKVWGADAITISPYLGQDSVSPFLKYAGKAVFVLCYTSNPSAHDLQEFANHETRLFEHVAQTAQNWGNADELAFVVGATHPHALARARQIAPDRWFLAPGVGAQGGNLQQALSAGLNAQGEGMIVPVSRAVTYADDPRQAAHDLRKQINQARTAVAQPINADDSSTDRYTSLIQQLHEVGCVQLGEFTLASGKQSPIYIDLRRVTASAGLLKLVAQAYADMLRPLSFDHVAGVPYAALPIGTAVALTMNRSLIYPRKEVKQYGLGRSIEGRFEAGDTVVVVEDLVTSGSSAIKAIEQLTAADLVVRDVAVLIDREQGGSEAIQAKGYTLHAVLTMPRILNVLHQTGRISAEELARVQAGLL
ncbi:orotidine-5'-phosphate decarboxylase [Anaerolineales bacterium HSG6]|nr:orotidine-5'-phosphate decarboxylase [Anaerolineales bacterium HSG6]MDM8529927.1 orotidine-5'-phosphate decarboxylase [Anaerolineales bacterium HSG25]